MSKMSQSFQQTIEGRQHELATAIVDRQWELDPELDAKYGPAGHAKCVQDVTYNLSYLSEAITTASPALFENYIGWVKVLFAGLNIPTAELAASLEITQEVLQKNLSPELAGLVPDYIEAGLNALQDSPENVQSFIDLDHPLGSTTRRYLDLLLEGERHQAGRLILDAIENETASVKEIYLNVFQPAQKEVGLLWQTNQISVAQEHYCTAATQMIMSQLYPYIFATEKIGYNMVATCVGNELHEVGLRMVSDFFEIEGWDTYYLGANTPAVSILQAIEEQQANILAISATMTFHVSKVADLIEHVHRQLPHPPKIMVGGYPFNVEPTLWQRLGADGSAHNAQQAVDTARRLIGNGG